MNFNMSVGQLKIIILTIGLIVVANLVFSQDVSIPLRSIGAIHNFTERECTMCKFTIGLVSYALRTRRGAEQITHIADNFCTIAHIESPLVCSNISRLFEHEITKVIAYGFITPDQICGILSNNTCGYYHNPLADWQVNLEASTNISKDELVKMKLSRQKGRKRTRPYKVLHISDPHVDLDYQVGSVADCNEPICCQSLSTPTNTSSQKAGKWGADRCDIPMRTFESSLKYMRSLLESSNDILYVIWTGDLQPHDVWKQNRENAKKTYSAIFDKIYEYFPDTKIFPTLGNHEMVPVDSFSPSNLLNIAREDSPEWLYKFLGSYWSKWLPIDTTQTIMKDGFYSVEVRKGLRIISLNTNFCHNKNFWLYINSTDPGNQLQWLIHELHLAEMFDENVHIIGHIPPGCDDCFGVWSKNFNQILRRFSKVVTSQFYGHTHMDEFELFYDKIGQENDLDSWKPISVGYIAPAITTVSGNNPAFRLYTVDPGKNFSTVDYETHFMNLTRANNDTKIEEPQWIKTRLFTEEFNLEDTAPESLHKLIMELTEELRDTSIKHFPGRQNATITSEDSKVSIGDETSKLYKLYRLYHTFSDSFNDDAYKTLHDDERRKFLCSFVTGQSHDKSACDHFIKVRV